tara:strand:- start:68 stop:214 length:147 start_codon:yes stop_codon:yes gene_type:complete
LVRQDPLCGKGRLVPKRFFKRDLPEGAETCRRVSDTYVAFGDPDLSVY